MSAAEQKVVQYLNEAHAAEHALVRVLQEQIAVTPRGKYRTGLDRHLTETRRHAEDVGERLEELGQGGNPLLAAVGLAETVAGQVVALSKTPLNLLRGSGGAEKVLKNAKDSCATEALEIATYTALERLARVTGDEETAELAAGILVEEQRMLEEITAVLPELTDAVIKADVKGQDAYDFSTTGAGETIAKAVKETKKTASKAESKAKQAASETGSKAKKGARQARKVPGVAAAEGEVKGALADEQDLALSGYNSLTADEITSKLPGLSQVELAKIDAYERKHENRSTVVQRIDGLRGQEPWPGYDEQNAQEITKLLAAGDDKLAVTVRGYERGHKARAGVMSAAEREHSSS